MPIRRLSFAALAVSTVLALSACSSVQHHPAYTAGKTYHLTILHTNDHHGHFWRNDHEEYGMAARKTLIDQIRQEVAAEGGSVLLLSGGDINTGVPESDLQDAEPDFKGMKMLGYDAMAIGNHEFDNPLNVLRQQQNWAVFPLLSANIYDHASGKRLFDPYHIFDVQGIKIAVMGLTTEDTAKIGNPEYLNGIDFRNPIAEAAKLVPSLHKQADIVIAATHMGHYDNAQHGINAPGDVSLARQVPGIDLVVGGHSQDPVCMQAENVSNAAFQPGDPCVPDTQNGTIIVQAHEWGKYVGRADFTFKDGKLTLDRYQLIPINMTKKVKVDGESKRVLVGERIQEDPAMLAFLTPYQEKGQKELSAVVASSNGTLDGDRKDVRFHPTNLGELIAVAQMNAANADLGIVNSGGVRDSIEAGQITYKDVLKVQPFANAVCFVEMTGKELKGYLATIAAMPVDSGAFAQFGGVSFKYANGAVSDVVVYGKGRREVQDNEMYRLSINSFSASGGDKYPVLDQRADFVNTGIVDAAALKDFLHARGTIDTAEFEPGDKVVRQ